MRLGPMEIVIILVVVLVIFGATRMAQIGQKIGSSGKGQSRKEEVVPIPHPSLQMAGIITVIAGATLLAISFGIMKAVAPYALWGVVIIAVGVTIVMIARHR